MVLLALADADYFTVVDIVYGRNIDGDILSHSMLCRRLN